MFSYSIISNDKSIYLFVYNSLCNILMKKVLIINILIFILISCNNEKEKQAEYFIENQTSFFDLRNSDWTKNSWIRKPENLKTIHETLKKVGYENLEKLIDKSDNEFLIRDIYIKRNFENLIDSLELSYNNDLIKEKYYKEFWKRRKLEKNDSIVFQIIKDFNSRNTDYEKSSVNDTLVNLFRIEFIDKDLTKQKAIEHFERLKDFGFHQSAYNLLFERYEYSEFDLDREKLKRELIKTKKKTKPWLQDNTK
jgi:hypothetical protein